MLSDLRASPFDALWEKVPRTGKSNAATSTGSTPPDSEYYFTNDGTLVDAGNFDVVYQCVVKKTPDQVVPDWAFMDLFTVPADVPLTASALFAPHGSSTGGRVNMNARPAPFETMVRTDPLAAVLFGCRKSTLNNDRLSLTDAQMIAKAIYDRKLAKGSALPKGKLYPSSGPPNAVYESPGEVAEIEGVADKGEESEELVREIANLITARGNVFSIYTVGQSLKQTPAGKLIVTGEQRQQAMVERFLRDKGTATTTDDEIGLRTVYFRNLMP